MGNVQSLSHGPVAYGQRYVRRKAYARSSSLTRQLLRSLGVSR